MLKKTIEFEDFDGNPVQEVFHFHVNKAELVELELSAEGGFAASLQNIIKSGNGQEIVDNFKKIILLAYGVKSEDGKRFVKSQALRDEFVQTEAYSALFFELATDADAAVAFINGIVPASMIKDAEQTANKQRETQTVELPTAAPVLEAPADSETRLTDDLSDEEILKRKPKDLTKAQLVRAMELKNQS